MIAKPKKKQLLSQLLLHAVLAIAVLHSLYQRKCRKTQMQHCRVERGEKRARVFCREQARGAVQRSTHWSTHLIHSA